MPIQYGLVILAVLAMLAAWFAARYQPVAHLRTRMRDSFEACLRSAERLSTLRDIVIGGGFIGPAIGLLVGAAEGSWLYVLMTMLVFVASVAVAMRIASVVTDLRAADEARLRRTIGGIVRSVVTQHVDRLAHPSTNGFGPVPAQQKGSR